MSEGISRSSFKELDDLAPLACLPSHLVGEWAWINASLSLVGLNVHEERRVKPCDRLVWITRKNMIISELSGYILEAYRICQRAAGIHVAEEVWFVEIGEDV
ncbi:hypothetical protein ADUPG1_012725 [Aduncisulcus paluster]|uniref:Uncharacterized protein n=1 Tax=Aduncisulcus paluster TaxID=2918883 RepID=A0ABQ5K0G6_9EUKA|nr:hypothetical protein ADUPG1_012725 [Aduncisulcus paluster]